MKPRNRQPEGTRVLVCGGRNFMDGDCVTRVLDEFHASEKGPIGLLIQGGASGADLLGMMWAKDNEVSCLTFEAEWGTYGRAAGPIRNKRMLKELEEGYVIAFPGGRGTGNMIGQAKIHNFPVIEIEAENEHL